MADASYFYGLGRRKAATARARLYKGKGTVTINDKPAADYLNGNKTLLAEITDPLALVNKQKEFDVTIRVSGGGLSGSRLLRHLQPLTLTFVRLLRRQTSSSVIHARKSARSTVSDRLVSANNSQSVNRLRDIRKYSSFSGSIFMPG